MTQESLIVETWAEKCERLAREVKVAAATDPLKRNTKQRDAVRASRYALNRHLMEVPDA